MTTGQKVEDIRNKFEEWALGNGVTNLYPASYAAAWSAWQEQQKVIEEAWTLVKLLVVTCDRAAKTLAEVPAKIASMQSIIDEQRIRIAYLQKQADRLEGLRKLCGYVEDGSCDTIAIGQDDATRDWFIHRGKKCLSYGENFNSAIDVAIAKEPKDD